jgi:superfamily II DNA helicase RecQ
VALEGDTLTLLDPGADLSALSGLRRIAEAQVASVERYGKTRGCRRRKLLEYFGERVSEKRCGRCDRCARPAHVRVGEMILKAPALFGWSGSQ